MTDSKSSDVFWSIFKIIFDKRWLVIGVTGFTGIAAVVISLFMTNWYLAETRVLIPGQTSSGLLSTFIGGRVGGSTSSLLGGLVSDYQRELAILNSRTIKASVVKEHNLIEVYNLTDSEFPLEMAIKELDENIEFVVDNEYNYLAVQVYDTDPKRAAEISNFFVSELNRVGIDLSTETARSYRRSVEKRYQEIEDSLDTVRRSLRALQKQTGIMDLPTQGAAFMEALTEWRSQIFQSELELDHLLFLYGENHSQTRAAQRAVERARESYALALQGRERIMPISQDSLPEVAFRFTDLQIDSIILTTLIEHARPLLEDARLSEERAAKSVQILDPAVPPTEKARPWRAAICVVSTLSGFLVSLLYVLISAWWKRSYASIASKLS